MLTRGRAKMNFDAEDGRGMVDPRERQDDEGGRQAGEVFGSSE